jgi:hypothetical protein
LEADFSAKAFAEVIAILEKRTTWRYSGQPSVLIFTVEGHPDRKISFGFDQVLDFDFARALKSGSLESPEVFFETLIRVSKDYSGDVAQHRLSDVLGGSALGKSICAAVLAYLKLDSITPLVGGIRDFRLKDRSVKEM